jgi:hypothetical protein
MPESKVYILAGCSKHCGYPLGPEMKADLERFGQSLDPATSPRLQKAVADTTALWAGLLRQSTSWFKSFTMENSTKKSGGPEVPAPLVSFWRFLLKEISQEPENPLDLWEKAVSDSVIRK